MYSRIKHQGYGIKSFLSELGSQLTDKACQLIESQLESEVDVWLYRQPYQRRSQVSRQSQASCQSCGSQRAGDFMRNGHRPRQLVTCYAVLRFWLPRVKCQCNGSVKIPFSILKPYQQIWDDVCDRIGRWADLGLSLRQMQREIGEQIGTQRPRSARSAGRTRARCSGWRCSRASASLRWQIAARGRSSPVRAGCCAPRGPVG